MASLDPYEIADHLPVHLGNLLEGHHDCHGYSGLVAYVEALASAGLALRPGQRTGPGGTVGIYLTDLGHEVARAVVVRRRQGPDIREVAIQVGPEPKTGIHVEVSIIPDDISNFEAADAEEADRG